MRQYFRPDPVPLRHRLGLGGWLILISVSAALARGQTLSDHFETYSEGSDAGPAWEPLSEGWAVAGGSYHGDAGSSVWRAGPWAGSVSFACELTVIEALPGDWLTAGIGLQTDERNFWALNLVAAPESQQRRHFTELHEMLEGVWQAQGQAATRLEPLPGQGWDFNWQAGETYRLELDLSVSNIVGRVWRGKEAVSRFGYRVDGSGPAVRVVRPMVRAQGLRTRFDRATVTVRAPAPEPVRERKPVPAWASRPGKPLAQGTGFFRTVETEGRWWLVDPEGKPFFAIGTDHINYRGHWCEALGYAPYNRNVAAKYACEAAWAEVTLDRLKRWGFNTLPAGHSVSLRHRGLAHIEFANVGASFARREWICRPIHWTGFPDVFSPRWEGHCRMVARRVARESRGDPWCIGAFLDNELEWYGKRGHLVDEVFELSPRQPAKKAFHEWLIQHFGGLQNVNEQLGTAYSNEQAFLGATNVPRPSPALERVREGFLSLIAERYFGVAARALREADPDHLVLGCRFAGQAPAAVLSTAGQYNDVFTINTYPRVDFENLWLPDGTGGVVERVPRQLGEYYAVVRKPMILTEWSFPALDSGLPCRHGAGMRVDTQQQKATCYRIFANAMADLPFLVGYHYFMWMDEPALGISSTFPEDSNYGLVNEQDEPYQEFCKVVTEVNQQAAARHENSRFSGLLALAAGAGQLEVLNTNALASHGHLRLTIQGRSRIESLRLHPGERRRFDLPTDQVWCAEWLNWDGSRQRVVGGPVPSDGLALVNVSSRLLEGLPVVVENGGGAAVLVSKLAPGESRHLQALPLNLQKQQTAEFKSVGTTWRCTGKTGALFDLIEADGLPLGRLVFAVHQRFEGRDHWVETTRLEELETQEHPEAWVLEAVVENPGASHGPAGYRARVRAVVFKGPGLAFVRPLWVESLDQRPWDLVEAYWFCRPAIGGSADDDVVGGPGVPQYYRRAQFLTDRKLGGCFGSLQQPGGWEVTFWTDVQGGIHPDSRLAVNLPMNRGKRWNAGSAPYLWVYASRRTEAWKEFSRLSQQAEQALIRP